MAKTLVVVESPTKANKIQEYLGKDYVVLASYGHIADLAKKGAYNLGVDIEKDFTPRYVLMDDKVKVLDAILSEAKKAKMVLLCGDNDREGTAISWHIQSRISDVDVPTKRVVFNQITKKAILKSVANPTDIDMNTVHSQEARRILDRVVGFMTSPFLMNCFGNGLSAGRVQSVVTRMIIDREREIENFVPEDYWTIQVALNTSQDTFHAKYIGKLSNVNDANQTKSKLDSPDYIVSSVIAEEEKKPAPAPMITSSLQRMMSKTHGFNAERTMKAAQALYESGYISYIRTDSVRVGDDEVSEVRTWLRNNNHKVPAKSNIHKNKDAAQDAHECIHPTDINLDPKDNFAIIDPDEKLVYDMVWKCFVASQMPPAVYNTLNVLCHPAQDTKTLVKASGKALKDKGFLEILGVEDMGSIDIPNLKIGDKLTLKKPDLKLEKKSTQAPGRFSEDKLIKELVNKNIGRPATYADLLSKITARNYVEKRGNVFHATDLGKKITDTLSNFFTFMDYNYTAKLEKQLDEIEAGNLNHIDMLKKFFPEFKKELDRAYIQHGGTLCTQCKSPMITRTSHAGSKFLGCSAYPRCKSVVNIS